MKGIVTLKVLVEMSSRDENPVQSLRNIAKDMTDLVKNADSDAGWENPWVMQVTTTITDEGGERLEAL